MEQPKEAIVRCAWLAGVFTLGCGVFGSLWCGLGGLGDALGAAYSQGIFWGFVVCWCLNGLALIGLLTANALTPAPLMERQTLPHQQIPRTKDN